MALFEMPLEKLKVYQGRNPRPKDFDQYWQRALDEMNSIDPKIELIPADFQTESVECFHLYFTGVKGARIHAKYLRPKNCKTPHPAVVQFHGYTASSEAWHSKLDLCSLGFSVLAMDVRGQGGLSEDAGCVKGTTIRGHIIRGLDDEPESLFFRNVFLDTAQLAKIAMEMPEVDPERVGAMGGSQGGGLTLACSALEPRIKRAVARFPFLCDYQRVWEMDLAERAYEGLKYFFMQFDPQHKKENEIFTRLGYIDCQHLAPKIKANLLMCTGLMDKTCPPSTQFAAYNKVTSEKQMAIYPDYEHASPHEFHDMSFQFLAKL